MHLAKTGRVPQLRRKISAFFDLLFVKTNVLPARRYSHQTKTQTIRSISRDELKRILEGVQELPDDRREALIMRFALGMDNREIARAMGRTDGATKVLIHRAIKQLEGIVAVEA